MKTVLGSVHKMNMECNVVAMDGDKSCKQNKETNEKTLINYEQGQYVMYLWVPVKQGEVAKETEKVLKSVASQYWPRSVKCIRVSHGGLKCRKSA